MRLPGRTIIVTGGAAGIGATYAAGLVREGAVVYIADVADGTSIAAEPESVKRGGTSGWLRSLS